MEQFPMDMKDLALCKDNKYNEEYWKKELNKDKARVVEQLIKK